MGGFWKGLEMPITEALEDCDWHLMGDSDQSAKDQNADKNADS